VSAPTTTEDLVEQIREVFAQARAAGQPLPGRPTLAKLTGATDYRVRVALEQLAKTDPDTGGADGGPGEDGDPDLANADPAGEIATSAGTDDRQPSATGSPLADELTANKPPTAHTARSLANSAAAGHASSAPGGGQHSTSPPEAVPATGAPAGARIVSWAGFVFGSVMSVAANVLHTWLPVARMPAGWTPGIAAQIGAAVWPIALLLSVEVLSRVPWRRGRLWSLARFGGAGTVALGSAVISYGHVQDVLAAWGYSTLAAHVGPLALDGLMVISGFALLAMSSSPITAGPDQTQ
jgi:hypothetical protein